MNKKESLLSDRQIIKYGSRTCIAICHQCETEQSISTTSYWNIKQRDKIWVCYKCRLPNIIQQSKTNPLYSDDTYKEQFRLLHTNQEYRDKVHNAQTNAKISISSKKAWQDSNKRANHMRHRQTIEFKNKISQWAKNQWKNIAYRNHQKQLRTTPEYITTASTRSKKLWQNPEYRQKIIAALDAARPKSVPINTCSSLQRILYSILDSLSICYWPEGPETILGPIITTKSKFEGYSFDCLVRHENIKMFIECNGDYWHKTSDRTGRDLAKATFLKQYFPDYELLVLWEYEFRSATRIKDILIRKLNIIEYGQIEFDFDDIIINNTPNLNQIRCFLATNHYLANIGRDGSLRIIATLNDEIIAAAVFAHPTRKESYTRLALSKNEIYELTRFCISARHHKQNFASWFLSRCLRIVHQTHQEIRTIITFADTTFEHNGTIYKATNWKYDGETKPDYWYVDGMAWYHKKSIWDLANKNNMTEIDYAISKGLHKVIGKRKLRFLYTF